MRLSKIEHRVLGTNSDQALLKRKEEIHLKLTVNLTEYVKYVASRLSFDTKKSWLIYNFLNLMLDIPHFYFTRLNF